MVRLAQWSSSENYGRWGTPGDQRKDPNYKTADVYEGEADIVEFQPAKWERIFRLIDQGKAELLANKAEAAVRNPHNGYAWDAANTEHSFYRALKAAGWDPAAITEDNNANCSSGVAALLCSVGISVDPDMWTGTALQILTATGEVLVLDDSCFVSSSRYMRRGDILHRTGKDGAAGHMAIVIDNGEYAVPLPMITTGRSWQRMSDSKLSQGLRVIEADKEIAALLPELGGRWHLTIYNNRTGWESKAWFRPLRYFMVSAYRCNLRRDPGLAGQVQKTLSNGDILPATGREYTDTRGVIWYQVASGSVIGWISELMGEVVNETEMFY